MLERAWMTIMHGNGKLWGIQAWSRFSIFNMCYRALFTRSVIMAISAWINQLYSYNLLFARDVMTISNIPLDAIKFSVYQILFHYDYSWFYEWYLVSNKFSDCWLVLNTYIITFGNWKRKTSIFDICCYCVDMC